MKNDKKLAGSQPGKSDSEAGAAGVVEHAVRVAFSNNIGYGWRIECLCGWISSADCLNVGAEFDEHLATSAAPSTTSDPAVEHVANKKEKP